MSSPLAAGLSFSLLSSRYRGPEPTKMVAEFSVPSTIIKLPMRVSKLESTTSKPLVFISLGLSGSVATPLILSKSISNSRPAKLTF